MIFYCENCTFRSISIFTQCIDQNNKAGPKPQKTMGRASQAMRQRASEKQKQQQNGTVYVYRMTWPSANVVFRYIQCCESVCRRRRRYGFGAFSVRETLLCQLHTIYNYCINKIKTATNPNGWNDHLPWSHVNWILAKMFSAIARGENECRNW